MKIGDKIKCTKWDNGLTVGQEYEVFSYEPTWCGENRPVITVEKGEDAPPYYADYFALTNTTKNKENKMKIGQTIKCINAQDSNSLFLNGKYTVTDINQHGNIQVTHAMSREPLQHYYKPNRFEVVAESAVSNKIDITKEYQTRDGRKVKILAISDDVAYPVVGQILDAGKQWFNENWTLDGKIYNANDESFGDLVEVKNEEYFSILSDSVILWPDGSIAINDADFSKEVFSEIIEKYEKFNA
jgi:hypothetical protein